jgi:hypothetical protein
MMNPQVASSLAGQRRAELRSAAAECRRKPVRFIPRWHVSLARIRLSQSGSSLVIIISASRVAWQDRNQAAPQTTVRPLGSQRAHIAG